MGEIPKRNRVLVEVIEDGSAKTFVYRDLDEPVKLSRFCKFWRLLKCIS